VSAAEGLVHPALAPAAGRPPGEAPLSDRARLAVLLQAAGLLSLCEAAGWSLARGWSGAAVDRAGILSGLAARPGSSRQSAQELLRGLLLALFRGAQRIAGRGEARRAARDLLASWQGTLAPMSADEAIGRILDAAPFLWRPEFTAARQALAGGLARQGRTSLWLAGPPAVRRRRMAGDDPSRAAAEASPRRLAAAGHPEEAVRRWREAPPRSAEDQLAYGEALYALGRFEAALLVLGGREDAAALTLAAGCHLLLGDLAAARDAVGRLEAADLSPAERLAAGDVVLRVLALAGERQAAADWAAAALAATRGDGKLLAHLLAATAALDREDPAAAERHLLAAEALRERPELAWRWHEVKVWQALESETSAAVVEHSRALLLARRRRMRRFEAGRAWNNLGIGYSGQGDFARAERAFHQSARLLRLCDGPLALTLAQWNLADVRLRNGRLLDVEPLLRAATEHNRRSGNRRGLAFDEGLWIRLDLVRGQPESAVARYRRFLVEQERWGSDDHRANLKVLAARALGWLERREEAADELAGIPREALAELEPEELPALYALAGRHERARELARRGEVAPLWQAVLDGTPPSAAALARLDRLEGFRRARLVLDLELVAPGVLPEAQRAAAATHFRRLGATRYAALLERGECGGWRALRTYVGQPLADPAALAELLRALGHPEARLTWRGPGGDRRLVEGSGEAGEEISAPVGGGVLLLAAGAIDEALRAAFALVARDLAPAALAGAPRPGDGLLIGRSPNFLAAVERLQRFAASEMPVLLLGESGTGKELAAQEVRRLGPRASGPWMTLNCAALSETLALSELFGHARGAFTGADRAHAGIFESAHRGTVFLDEIGDLAPVAQGNLLRALQEGEIRRLGETMPRKVDVRVVAATHRDLSEMVRCGAFRQDLFYRLKVCAVAIPPLRERGDDVLLLAEHFLARLRQRSPHLRLTPEARQALLAYPWPGNVRELGHVLSAAATLAGDAPIERRHLDLEPHGELAVGDYHRSVEEFRRAAVRNALVAARGNRAEAARRLGLSRQALSYLVRELAIEPTLER